MNPASPVLGRERAFALAEEALRAARAARADEAEVVILTEDAGLTRYAANRVHQNVSERNLEIRVRVARGRRVAVASGNQAAVAAVRGLAERAATMAAHSPEDPHYPGLPEPNAPLVVDQTTFYEATAQIDAAKRAQAVAETVELLQGAGALGYGVVTNAVTELAVANTRGIRAHQSFTDAWLSVIARRDRGGAGSGLPATGYAADGHRDWSEVDPESAALRALAKASLDPPRRVPPGRYTVVLEEAAVAELLSLLASSALNGLEVLEGRSLYSGRLGERRYPAWITLRDDPTDVRGANVSFDFEGVPKAPLTLVREGVLEQVAWDSATAHRAGVANTAHALPAPTPHGPMPLNLVLSPGRATRAQLLGQVHRGLLVTRFHYVNEVDPAKTLLTGMTRDGTFLIEDGRVVAPVQDLRWVESVDGVLRRTVAVGNTLKLVSEGPGYGIRYFTGTLAPALLVEGFAVTGSAEQ
ncbi:MAG: TldD/PmbA family protein [Actinobacteria bacterium]|nr:TldD/PmbA family protein [Actinomycetota bacterium]